MLPDPVPGPGEILVRVAACGVCHTELDEIEGRTPPPRLPVILGHQVVGQRGGARDRARTLSDRRARRRGVDLLGVRDVRVLPVGPTRTCARASARRAAMRTAAMPSCMVVPERFAYRIPDAFSDVEAAPLLCARAPSAIGRCD